MSAVEQTAEHGVAEVIHLTGAYVRPADSDFIPGKGEIYGLVAAGVMFLGAIAATAILVPVGIARTLRNK